MGSNTRQLVKRVLRQCYRCKKFHVKIYLVPQRRVVVSSRTKVDLPFKIIGIDYAGPFLCKSKRKKERKLYLLLFTFSLSRAIHLEFIHPLKRLMARRGRIFCAASKWIKKNNKHELMQAYLIKEENQWKINLSRAHWWGGQLGQMVGLVKQCLCKTTGRTNLNQKKFEEIALDIEVILNNGSMMYAEEDIQMPVLTRNTLLCGQQ